MKSVKYKFSSCAKKFGICTLRFRIGAQRLNFFYFAPVLGEENKGKKVKKVLETCHRWSPPDPPRRSNPSARPVRALRLARLRAAAGLLPRGRWSPQCASTPLVRLRAAVIRH